MIEKFKCLHDVSLSYLQLEKKIQDRNLTDYVVESIKQISARVGDKAIERTFEGLALEAVFGEQLEVGGVDYRHNTSPTIFWYDMEFPSDGVYMDVKKHTGAKDAKWLSIYNSSLNPGNQLFHIRQNAELEKLYILFVSAVPADLAAEEIVLQISPTWVVRADSFFDNLKVGRTPGTSYYCHPDCREGIDYLRF